MPLGDILVIKEEYRKVADQLSEIILSDLPWDGKVLIAVGGESGSGKSEIAHVISDNLFKSEHQLQSFILHVDDFFLLPRKERNELRSETQFESVGIDEIDRDELELIVQKFMEDKNTVHIPIYDILSSVKHDLVVDFQGIPVLIAEGLYANLIDADYSAFIDRTYHDTKKFQAERGKEVMDEFRLGVLEKEHQAVSQLKNKANIIIDKNYALTRR